MFIDKFLNGWLRRLLFMMLTTRSKQSLIINSSIVSLPTASFETVDFGEGNKGLLANRVAELLCGVVKTL